MSFVGYLGWYKPSYKLSKGSDLTIALPKYNKKKNVNAYTGKKDRSKGGVFYLFTQQNYTAIHGRCCSKAETWIA